MRVTELWRYPVKSMGGERLSEVRFGERGLAGDRGWALRDPASGLVLSAKRVPALLTCDARTDRDRVLIDLPDGRVVPTDDPEASGVLSAYLNRDVELIGAGEGAASYEAGADLGEDDGDTIVYPCPPGTHFDAATLHAITTSTIDRFEELYPDGDFDVRRFRPNLVIEATLDAYENETWVGQTMRCGDLEATVVSGCPRCVMTTRPQDDLPQDKGVLQTIARQNGNMAGVYAFVRTEGVVRVGDPVSVQPS